MSEIKTTTFHTKAGVVVCGKIASHIFAGSTSCKDNACNDPVGECRSEIKSFIVHRSNSCNNTLVGDCRSKIDNSIVLGDCRSKIDNPVYAGSIPFLGILVVVILAVSQWNVVGCIKCPVVFLLNAYWNAVICPGIAVFQPWWVVIPPLNTVFQDNATVAVICIVPSSNSCNNTPADDC